MRKVAAAVLALVWGTVAAAAGAQSMRKCFSSDGSVWYTHQSCPLPNPHGDHLRKCVSPKGQVTYQQEPRAKGWKLTSTRDATPEPAPTPEQLRQREYQRRKAEAESAYLRGIARRNQGASAQGHSIPVPGQGGGQCAAAKAERERVLDIVGLKRTYDLLRALDEQVYNACK